MNYTLNPQQPAQLQRQALGGWTGAGRVPEGRTANSPTALDALLYGAAGQNVFDPKFSQAGPAFKKEIPTGKKKRPGTGGTATPPSMVLPPFRRPAPSRGTPPGMPTTFNPGMLDPSKLGTAPGELQSGVREGGGRWLPPRPVETPGLRELPEKEKVPIGPSGGYLTNF